MDRIILKDNKEEGISPSAIKAVLSESVREKLHSLKKVLIIPPDFTRFHSMAGTIASMYYGMLKDSCQVDILPALGTHQPMSPGEIKDMFGKSIPAERFLVHNWRKDVVKIGEVPESFVKEVSEGIMDEKIDVEVNRRLLDKKYDLIISVGQVVPHEVIGMANYSKNIFVGCGGSSMISSSHMLGAFYGLERIMGRDKTPVRKVFDYAEEHFIKDLPIMYVLTVIGVDGNDTKLKGLFVGRDRGIFEEAVALSQKENIKYVDAPLKKVVVYLDGDEFKTTWVGNKAVYRTRMAIADGGELIVLAPGVKKFGEDEENDWLIREYGYVGREKVLELFKENKDLQENQSVAAHLIHGSSDGRFSVTYAVEKISRAEIESVNFKYMDLSEAYKKYDPKKLKDGFNTLEDGEKIYYISNPALGLWAVKNTVE